MKQEDKELLLRDLCARLPYGVVVAEFDEDGRRISIELPMVCIENDFSFYGNVRPYLFPLSSMTEEQKEELENLGWYFDNFEINNVNECLGTYREYVAHSDCFVLIDWLNKNYFDYRGLIPKGLAIDATDKNIY